MIGYARASSTDQSTEIQETALLAAGCTVVRSEQKSGTSMKGRAELETVLSFLREGDVLAVTRVDRLARSLSDLETIVTRIRAKGANLKVIEQPVDTSSAAGSAFLQMLGVFAQFETSLRKERQLEGIEKAKKNGAYKGRKPSVPTDEVLKLRAKGMGASEIAKELGIGRASVYRVLSGDEKASNNSNPT
jgi:DNA invertase Pin-like site-specific DNA recombinase